MLRARTPTSVRQHNLVEEAHTVSHFQRAVLKIGNYLIIFALVMVSGIITVCDLSWRPYSDHVTVRFGADRSSYPCSNANSVIGDHGGWCALAGQEKSDCEQVGGY